MATTSLNSATATLKLEGVYVWDYPKNTPSSPFSGSFEQSFTEGTGAAQANGVFSITGTIGKSGTVDIDLGAATDPAQNSRAFATIRALWLYNNTDVAGVSIQMGAAASNPISSLFAATNDKLVVANNGVAMLATADASGYAITEDSADILRLTNASATHVARYELVVLGTFAADASSSSSSYSSASSASASSASSSSSYSSASSQGSSASSESSSSQSASSVSVSASSESSSSESSGP